MTIGSSAYDAGLEKGDKLLKIGNTTLNNDSNINDVISQYKPNDTVAVVYERFGVQRETQLTFKADPTYSISLSEEDNVSTKANREAWLGAK